METGREELKKIRREEKGESNGVFLRWVEENGGEMKIEYEREGEGRG